jgi:hypothetical protein
MSPEQTYLIDEGLKDVLADLEDDSSLKLLKYDPYENVDGRTVISLWKQGVINSYNKYTKVLLDDNYVEHQVTRFEIEWNVTKLLLLSNSVL